MLAGEALVGVQDQQASDDLLGGLTHHLLPFGEGVLGSLYLSEEFLGLDIIEGEATVQHGEEHYS